MDAGELIGRDHTHNLLVLSGFATKLEDHAWHPHSPVKCALRLLLADDAICLPGAPQLLHLEVDLLRCQGEIKKMVNNMLKELM